jgi:hypothetical protein
MAITRALRRGDWHSGDTLGNFPEAFAHFTLISAAFNLDRALGAGGT